MRSTFALCSLIALSLSACQPNCQPKKKGKRCRSEAVQEEKGLPEPKKVSEESRKAGE